MDRRADAFGQALLDWSRGGSDLEMYERDDGFIEAGPGPELYLAGRRAWPGPERRALRFARGRVADVGCGGGRVALELQQRGLDVVGVDSSPLALRAARRHGVAQVRCMTTARFAAHVGGFDTVVLFGNNLGIFGTPERLRTGLAGWARRTGPTARILAESTDPAGGAPAFDAAYRRRNEARGLPPGQLRLRVRYHDLATPWFWWLFVSPAELHRLVEGTGWRVERLLEDERSAPYVAVLAKA